MPDELYTAGVERSKLIHAVLTAALLFSQLAASIHVTGHLHDHDHEHPHQGFQNSSGIAGGPLHLSPVVTGNHSFISVQDAHFVVSHEEAPHAGDRHEESLGCELFHLLLNLNGGFVGSLNNHSATLHHSLEPGSVSSVVACGALNKYRIRAPPVIS